MEKTPYKINSDTWGKCVLEDEKGLSLVSYATHSYPMCCGIIVYTLLNRPTISEFDFDLAASALTDRARVDTLPPKAGMVQLCWVKHPANLACITWPVELIQALVKLGWKEQCFNNPVHNSQLHLLTYVSPENDLSKNAVGLPEVDKEVSLTPVVIRRTIKKESKKCLTM